MHVIQYACMHVCMYACMNVCMHEYVYILPAPPPSQLVSSGADASHPSALAALPPHPAPAARPHRALSSNWRPVFTHNVTMYAYMRVCVYTNTQCCCHVDLLKQLNHPGLQPQHLIAGVIQLFQKWSHGLQGAFQATLAVQKDDAREKQHNRQGCQCNLREPARLPLCCRWRAAR